VPPSLRLSQEDEPARWFAERFDQTKRVRTIQITSRLFINDRTPAAPGYVLGLTEAEPVVMRSRDVETLEFFEFGSCRGSRLRR
jgi:hypothetical protein